MVGSISSGKTLTLSVNAQMYDTGLTDAVSDYVQNEVQNIIIDSDIIKAGYVRRNTISLFLNNSIQNSLLFLLKVFNLRQFESNV